MSDRVVERRADDARPGLLWRWGPSVVLMALIWGFSSLSSVPGPESALLDLVLKKGAHALGYGLLALANLRALAPRRHAVWIALLLTLLYAISDEWHQTWVPGRNGRPLDVLIDLGGAIGALVVRDRVGDRE